MEKKESLVNNSKKPSPDCVFEKVSESLKQLDNVAKTLEKETNECKNVCAGLEGAIKEIDGAIRGEQ